MLSGRMIALLLVVGLPIAGVVYASGNANAEADARRVLLGQGIKPSSVGGYGWFACSEDDVFRTRFEGIGPTGARVSGTVCKGWFKGATVRFD